MIGCMANGVTELRPISYEAGRRGESESVKKRQKSEDWGDETGTKWRHAMLRMEVERHLPADDVVIGVLLDLRH